MNTLTVSCLLLACASHQVVARVTGKSGNLTIFSGHPVSITEVPFMARFTKSGYDEWCGASIVHQQFLVTACHCYHDRNKQYHVTVGTDKLHGGQNYEIQEFFQHPKYDYETGDYDILVIKLKERLVFTESVQKIKMADPNLVIREGEMLDTMGFGFTDPNIIKTSEKLLKVDVPYYAHDKCKALFKDNDDGTALHVTDRMICAGGQGGSFCYGDSGGPLRYKNELAGIVAFGIDCGTSGYPGVYTSVSAVRDFIDDVIENNE